MDEIYQKYAQLVYRFLLARCHNDDTAQELTQETFFRAVEGFGRYDGSCHVTTWLCAIAKNVYMEYLRKNPSYEDITEMADTVESGQSVERDVLGRMGRLDILKMVHGCPEPYREVMYLRLLEDMPFKEIGEVCGQSENWARVTFYRGKTMLIKEIKNNEQIDM